MTGNGLSDVVADVLKRADIPEALFGVTKESDVYCTCSGYRITDFGRRYVSVAIFGNATVGEVARQMARDELAQRIRAALDGAGFEIRLNEYGHITAVKREGVGGAGRSER